MGWRTDMKHTWVGAERGLGHGIEGEGLKREKIKWNATKKGPCAQTTIECHSLRNMTDSTLCTGVPEKKRGEAGSTVSLCGGTCHWAESKHSRKGIDSNTENPTLDTVTWKLPRKHTTTYIKLIRHDSQNTWTPLGKVTHKTTYTLCLLWGADSRLTLPLCPEAHPCCVLTELRSWTWEAQPLLDDTSSTSWLQVLITQTWWTGGQILPKQDISFTIFLPSSPCI